MGEGGGDKAGEEEIGVMDEGVKGIGKVFLADDILEKGGKNNGY